MLRIVLRILIAIGLVLQGSVGATAAYAASQHHCTMSGHDHGQAPKCPCCPAKSLLGCADICATVAALPETARALAVAPPSTPPAIETQRVVAAAIEMLLRPPIA
ncbi:MAG TPA: hypothetical protein VJX31_06370 [Casimicrobiaceae bacterium]|nr:hypothetical protein [Casimicrobiaceae bacterium]